MKNDRDSIYPYVVPGSWVDYTGLDSVITWQVSSDVFVVLVFDGKGTVRNVRPEDLAALQLDPSEAFQVAAHNLTKSWHAGEINLGVATLLDGVQVGCARGSWMAPAAALILGDFHAALSAQFGTSEFIAVAVNQECLFAFPADDGTLASASLRIALDDEYNGHRKPVSRQWLRLNGEWPTQYDGEQLF